MKFNDAIKILSLLFLCLYSIVLNAQGNLMLVGGGAESEGGWSDTPYQWMVNNAENKKIGIVSYSDADNWLPDYFASLGAIEAVNIKIDSRELAGHTNMFDSLNQFDALFFKGGDQSRYYDYYKNTAVQLAIEEIYNRGGVIGGTSAGMAILSGVIFTASNGSAYPYDAFNDINSQYMTLEGDFLQFYPDYIFDTHFIERGRTSRLIGFLAHWSHTNDQLIKGVGIDDRTAFCINAEGIGTVYGTGAASVYRPNNFQVEGSKVINSKIKSIQLTHGQSYDLMAHKTLDRELSNTSRPEMNLPYYQVFATSETTIGKASNMLDEVISNEKLGGKILIVSDSSNDKIADYHQFFKENSSSEIVVLKISDSESQEEQIALRNNIRESSLLVFLEPENLSLYFNSGMTGELLESHMKRNEITNVFLGPIANQLGQSYSNNIYQDPFNAYYNDLEFSIGLGLLEDFNIITKAYELEDKDYYENITSAVVDRMLNEQLKFGVYLTGDTYFSYTIDEGDKAVVTTKGELSSLMIENSGTRYSQTAEKVSGNISRLQYAFDSLNYSIMKGVELEIGVVSSNDQTDYVFEEEEVLSNVQSGKSGIRLLQNPVRDFLKLSNNSTEDCQVGVFTLEGRPVFNTILQSDVAKEFYVGHLPDSQYVIIVSTENSDKKYSINLLKTK